jgi:hypothetical protein
VKPSEENNIAVSPVRALAGPMKTRGALRLSRHFLLQFVKLER